MKKKLTLRIDETVIDRAKRVSAGQGKSISQIVEDYFRLAGEPLATADDLPPIHPDVLALTGLLEGSGLDEADYRRYLEAKHR